MKYEIVIKSEMNRIKIYNQNMKDEKTIKSSYCQLC